MLESNDVHETDDVHESGEVAGEGCSTSTRASTRVK